MRGEGFLMPSASSRLEPGGRSCEARARPNTCTWGCAGEGEGKHHHALVGYDTIWTSVSQLATCRPTCTLFELATVRSGWEAAGHVPR